MAQNTAKNLKPRPPIVVVMGHVDHGKTTLLDNIKKTNIAAREAGGITQSIGAYEIEHTPTKTDHEILRQTQDDFATKARKITFIDTPGHEAFSKMRARGAKLADLAVLVVAADDGVQPQTKESIDTLNQSKTPFIVAINKTDKPDADIEKIKNDLMQAGVFLEGAGGNISWQKISAKSGEGVNELLDLILLAAELENLTYEEMNGAKGVIIESKLDSRRGVVTSMVVEDGTLKTGDLIATESACGKIKSLENFKGEQIKELTPSAPALILGFDSLPQVGEQFISGAIEPANFKSEKAIVQKQKIALPAAQENKKTLNIIIKADVSGSLEALREIFKSLKTGDNALNIISESVGEITDGDVKTASAAKAIIVGFNVKANKAAENTARNESNRTKIITSKIIYELVQMIEKELKETENPAPLAEVETLAIFSQTGKGQLVGGKIINGAIRNNNKIKIIRQNEEIGFGKITSLKIKKQDVNQVEAQNECGIMIESNAVIAVGDKLIIEK